MKSFLLLFVSWWVFAWPLTTVKTSKAPPHPLASATPTSDPLKVSPTLEYIVISETPIPSPTPTITPTPTPTKTPPLSAGDLNSLMEKYARETSVDKNLLIKIAVCESNLNPGAVNGPYGGLYQFTEGAWRRSRVEMNANPDPNLRFDSNEAIRTAAYVIARGRSYIWPNCR